MTIYLHKILPIIFLPTGLVFLLMLAGLLFRRRLLFVAALALFWLASTPWIANGLARFVEQGMERKPAAEMLAADVIVILSEGRVVAPGAAAISEWTDGDRFWGGVELYRAGKAPLLVLTGGWSPWVAAARPDGEVMAGYAQMLGVPEKAIRLTGKVVNTAEEAQAVAAMLGRDKSVLLVTSAFHMPRSQRLFEQAGLRVMPYPVDFMVGAARELDVLDLLPRADAFGKTETAWRELLGRAYYRLRSLTG